MANALELREHIAYGIQGRIDDEDVKAGKTTSIGSGKRVIHHPEFIGYFVWKIAQIPYPNHALKGIINIFSYKNHYGESLETIQVISFLEELTGDGFEADFGFKADITDYRYLYDLIDIALDKEGLSDLDTKARAADVLVKNVERARDWLSEQIKIEKSIAYDLKLALSVKSEATAHYSEEPLPDELSEALNETNESVLLEISSPPNELSNLPKRTMRQVSLFHIYQGMTIGAEKADDIAKEYGFFALSSGRKLIQHYNKLMPGKSSRTGVSKNKINAMCKDISVVISYLPEEKRQGPREELALLRKRKEKKNEKGK